METKSKNLSLKAILIIIAIGIWAIVLQNAGIIPTDQRVKVMNEVNAYVRGRVDVNGSVNVDNTVSVSINEVLGKDGKKYYYNNSRYWTPTNLITPNWRAFLGNFTPNVTWVKSCKTLILNDWKYFLPLDY